MRRAQLHTQRFIRVARRWKNLARGNHPLNILQREKIGKKLSDIIKDIPNEKLDGLEKYLEDYAKKESRLED